MPINDPHDTESHAKSNIGSIHPKDVRGARWKSFISEKLKGAVAGLIVAILISLFCTLVYWLFMM